MPPDAAAGNGRAPRASGDGLVLHVRDSRGGPGGAHFTPMPVEQPVATEFELDNFKGKCMFLHRPAWTYDNPDTEINYPFKQLFHGRKRLWEWRLQGKFTRRPTTCYIGIELEDYVPVNFATRSLMRGILPLIQTAIQCKLVHHEVGEPDDPALRPAVVAPIWSADNTLIHEDPKDVPDIATPNLPGGLNRKAARQYWENLWNGGGPSWEDGKGGPTFTIAYWGPSQLLDLRAWVFRKLPLMWVRELQMEPFCGQQPVHAVVYELADGNQASRHRQEEKVYVADLRMMPEALWEHESMGGTRSPISEPRLGIAEHTAAIAEGLQQALPEELKGPFSDDEDFCSAHSGDSSPDPLAEAGLLPHDANGQQQNRASAANAPSQLLRQRRSRLPGFLRCCRRKKSGTARQQQPQPSARRPNPSTGRFEQLQETV